MTIIIYALLEDTIKICISKTKELLDIREQNNPKIDKSIIKLIKHIRSHTDMNEIYEICVKLRNKIKKSNMQKPILLDCVNTMLFIIRTNLESIHTLKESIHTLKEISKLKSNEITKLRKDVEFWKKSKSSIQLNQSNNIMLEIVPIYE